MHHASCSQKAEVQNISYHKSQMKREWFTDSITAAVWRAAHTLQFHITVNISTNTLNMFRPQCTWVSVLAHIILQWSAAHTLSCSSLYRHSQCSHVTSHTDRKWHSHLISLYHCRVVRVFRLFRVPSYYYFIQHMKHCSNLLLLLLISCASIYWLSGAILLSFFTFIVTNNTTYIYSSSCLVYLTRLTAVVIVRGTGFCV